MNPHPDLLARYRRIQQAHASVLPAGRLTAAEELRALDPCGVLSLALEIGEEEAVERLTQTEEGA